MCHHFFDARCVGLLVRLLVVQLKEVSDSAHIFNYLFCLLHYVIIGVHVDSASVDSLWKTYILQLNRVECLYRTCPSQQPGYLRDVLIYFQPSITLHLSSSISLIVPNRVKTITASRCVFRATAPIIGNKCILLKSVKAAESFNVVRRGFQL